MRFSIKFEIQGEEKKIPLKYRNMFLSILKKVFENSSTDTYEQYYHTKDGIKPNVQKPFTFGVYFPRPVFGKDEIEISEGYITLNFSTYDMEKGIYFFNGLLKQEGKEFSYKEYKLKIAGINMGKEKVVTSREVAFKTLSAIAVRVYSEEENRDEYIGIDNPKFIAEFEKSIRNRVESLTGETRDIKAEIINMKKNVIKHNAGEKEIYIDANSGTFKLKGDIDVLDLIYKAGVGARTGEGFGMIEIV